jgi:hypothetical protein
VAEQVDPFAAGSGCRVVDEGDVDRAWSLWY